MSRPARRTLSRTFASTWESNRTTEWYMPGMNTRIRAVCLRSLGLHAATILSGSHNGSVKSFRKELWFEVLGRRAFLNITPEVQTCLRESGIKEGLVLVNAMHITASVFIKDDEPGLHADYERWLEKLAPHAPSFVIGVEARF